MLILSQKVNNVTISCQQLKLMKFVFTRRLCTASINVLYNQRVLFTFHFNNLLLTVMLWNQFALPSNTLPNKSISKSGVNVNKPTNCQMWAYSLPGAQSLAEPGQWLTCGSFTQGLVRMLSLLWSIQARSVVFSPLWKSPGTHQRYVWILLFV